MRFRARPLLCLLPLVPVIAGAVRAAGAGATAFAGKEWALLDVKPVMQTAAGVTLDRYPNCDAVTVDERTVEAYRPDGTGECQDETFTKVLTEKGKRDNAVLSLGFLLPYFTVRVVRLEVIRPDGTITPVDVAANSRESIDQSQMQSNIYDPDSRVLQVNVPGLEIGDVVHSVARTLIQRPIMPRQFDDSFLFEGAQYIRHVSCEIRAPATMPLQHFAVRDPVKGTIAFTKRPGRDGTIVYDWEVSSVPRMYNEPSMPPPEMVLQRLLVSTIPDWRAVSRWYWKLSQAHLDATSPEMARTVARLTAGMAGDGDKTKAIFFYVSKNIRYMGVTPEHDRPGFEPHDVRLTYAKKYGVCRDKAALLVAMLRMAGEQAYPVLINVGYKLDPQIPSIDFDHAIVAVETGPGKYQLMDPTDEHTRVLLPAYDDNRSYLVCRPGGEDLLTSPVTPPDENMMRIRTTGVLAADGTLTATAEMAFGGVNDDAYRGAFAEMKPDERRRFFESRLQRAVPGARLVSLHLSPENMLDEAAPLRAEVTFTARAMAAFGHHEAIVDLPWVGRDFGIVNFILDGTGLAQRKYPYDIDATCGISEEVSLRLAPRFGGALSMPSASDQDGDSVSYRRRFGLTDDTLHGSEELKLKVVEFSPGQYLALKRVLADVDYDQRKAPVVAVAGPAGAATTAAAAPAETPVSSDAEVLEDRQQLDVKDAQTATLRVHYVKRILSYAGKNRESEVQIPYNPTTEEARLIHAVVTSASGQRQAASKDEINEMDAAWNPSAERYPGGKIFVDSLPGVEIGSTIDVEYEIRMHGKPFVAGFQAFRLPDKLEHKSFELTAPAGLPIETRETGAAGPLTETRRTADGRQVLTWQARDVGALPEESDLPPAWTFEPGVEYYVGDPAAYPGNLSRALLARAAQSTQAGALARRLAGAAPTRLDAVRAIRDFIAENVREAGPAFTDLPLADLSAADTTLADGYGHTADRAILFQAMLTAAGFHPEIVLASDLPPVAGLEKLARSFPRPDVFQTPLVRIEVGGQTLYLNDTDQYARLGSTAHDERLGLVLGSGAIVTIKAADNCRSRVATVYSLSLANDGGARIGIRREYYGMAYAEKNRRLTELRPEQRVRYFQEAVSRVAQGARPVGGLTTDFGGYPGVEQFSVEVPRYGIANGRFLYFSLPFTPRIFPTDTDRRTQPLLLKSDETQTIRAEIKLPPDYPRVVVAPHAGTLDGPDGAGVGKITAGPESGGFAVTYDLTRRAAIIDPADYAAARRVESELENRSARIFLLEGSPASPVAAAH